MITSLQVLCAWKECTLGRDVIPYQQSQHTSFTLPTSVAQPPSHEKEGHLYEQIDISMAATTSKEVLLLE